jgi:hypothetical protein
MFMFTMWRRRVPASCIIVLPEVHQQGADRHLRRAYLPLVHVEYPHIAPHPADPQPADRAGRLPEANISGRTTRSPQSFVGVHSRSIVGVVVDFELVRAESGQQVLAREWRRGGGSR